jgi:DNA-binding LacI/PurR family transcriptional regulator
LDYVDVDNAAAARLATEALLTAGHRQIAHVSGPIDVSSAARGRLTGYRAALRRAGVAANLQRVVAGNWRAESGRAAVAQWLHQRTPFTAIFAGNDGMANGAIEALREAGLKVPGDVSVVGVDGFTDHPVAGVDLSTVRQPLEAIGRAAAERLLARIAAGRGAAAPRRVFLPGALAPGATLAPPGRVRTATPKG